MSSWIWLASHADFLRAPSHSLFLSRFVGKAGTCDEAIRTFAWEARIENFKGKVGGGGRGWKQDS